VPVYEPDVRYAFFTEVGQREPFQPVLEADLIGPNARVKQIDDRLAKENPALAHVKPAMRLATAILMYSFGGLPKEGTEGGETLPPGVTEAELLAACVGPDLDNITAQACLKEMREVRGCLYLHFDGARYCFKTTPNVNMLIEQEAESVKPPEIRSAIKERLEKRLSGQRSAFVWPERSEQVPDEEPCFLIAYLPIEFGQQRTSEQDRVAKELFEKYGDRPRRYRNGIGLAVPAKAQLEPLRRAVRYLLAIERVESKKKQLGVTKEQAEQLRERQRTEEAAEESAFRQLYAAVWLPRLEGGAVGIEPVEIGGRPLQSTEIHARIMELLTVVSPPRLFGSLAPRRIVELLRLGEAPEAGQPARLGIRTREVQDAFFGILGFPRLTEQGVLRRAIVRGAGEGVFGYYGQGEPSLGTDGRYQVSLDRVAFQREVGEDEVDIADGFLIMPSAMPLPPEVVPPPVLDPVPGHTDDATISISGTSVAGALISVTGGAKPATRQIGSDEVGFSLEIRLLRDTRNTLLVTARDATGRVSEPAVVVVAQGGAPPPEPKPEPEPTPEAQRVFKTGFRANRQQLYAAWGAVANLAEKAGSVHVQVDARSEEGFDPQWLRNAVKEPLEEADVEIDAGGS